MWQSRLWLLPRSGWELREVLRLSAFKQPFGGQTNWSKMGISLRPRHHLQSQIDCMCSRRHGQLMLNQQEPQCTVDYFASFLRRISSPKSPCFKLKLVKFEAKMAKFQAKMVKFQLKKAKFQPKVAKFLANMAKFHAEVAKFLAKMAKFRAKMGHAQKRGKIIHCAVHDS